KTQDQQFNKDVYKQCSIRLNINAHNKCAELTIFASNASSSSKKVFKCSHNKDDSIFTQNFSTVYCTGITHNSHILKDEHMHYFTHSSLKITRVFSRLVMGLSVKDKRDKVVEVSSKKMDRLKRCQERFIDLTRVATKEVYCQIGSLFKFSPKIISIVFSTLINWTNEKNSRCHHIQYSRRPHHTRH
ncbi:hypothetical protein H5410_046222, partial [Solanum commersonii]